MVGVNDVFDALVLGDHWSTCRVSDSSGRPAAGWCECRAPSGSRPCRRRAARGFRSVEARSEQRDRSAQHVRRCGWPSRISRARRASPTWLVTLGRVPNQSLGSVNLGCKTLQDQCKSAMRSRPHKHWRSTKTSTGGNAFCRRSHGTSGWP
jgi:hypothetical protein